MSPEPKHKLPRPILDRGEQEQVPFWMSRSIFVVIAGLAGIISLAIFLYHLAPAEFRKPRVWLILTGAFPLFCYGGWFYYPEFRAAQRRRKQREFMLGPAGEREEACLECGAMIPMGAEKCPQCGWTWGRADDWRKRETKERRFKS